MFRFNAFYPRGICFETPDPGSGAGGAGTATATPPQPASGQGQGGDFWGLFPNVPEDQRSTLEPHLKNVQGEVTRLQQQQSAYKPLADAGYTPEQVQGLVNFDVNFSRDPLGTWLEMAKMLQEGRVIDGDLDLDVLSKYARGEEVPDDEEPGAPGAEVGTESPEMTQLVQYIETLEQRIEQMDQRDAQRESARQQAVQDRLLQAQRGRIRDSLKAAGFSEEALTDTRINAAIIANRGNPQAALDDLMGLRTTLLKGVTDRANGGDELELPNGAPPVPSSGGKRGGSRDPFENARAGATDFLRRQRRAAAQG